ncbi:MAG: response regulator, partial [Candidatus Omnitrophica bacterium]|nr:response regulator [Candidatus Omnitrophota bacterium]
LEIARANLERRVEERTSQLAEELAERKRLQHQLLQAQKLESIGRLAGGVAHEINNMMTGVLGFAEMAEAQAKDHPGIRDDLRQISVAGQRVAQITRQLLTFARRQASKRASIDLGALVRSLEPFLLRVVGENVRLSVSVADGVPRINADASQIEQLIVNLVMNARDAVTGQGTIQIELASTVVDEVRQIGTFEILPGDYVRLAVVDSGVGISAEARSRLFEPFFTTKEVGKGTGLGLSTAHEIIRKSSGLIDVESKVGDGTTFRVRLPGVEAPPSTVDKESLDSSLLQGRETILVVEDEEVIRKILRRMLTQYGYSVLVAGRVEEALRLYRERGDSINLVVTDVIMPDMNGLEFAQEVERLRPGAKVLFLSGYTDAIIAKTGVLEQRVHFLGKPFTAEELIGKVREVLDSPPSAPSAI